MIRRAVFGMTALALVTLVAPTYALADLVFQFSNTTQAGNNGALTDAYEGYPVTIDSHYGTISTVAGVYPAKIANAANPTDYSGLGATNSNYYPGGAIGFNTFCVDIAHEVTWGQQYSVADPLTPLASATLTDVMTNVNTSLAIGYIYATYGPGNSSFAWSGGGGETPATWEAVQLAIWTLLDSSLKVDGLSIATYAGNSDALVAQAHQIYKDAYDNHLNDQTAGGNYQIVTSGVQEFLVPSTFSPNVPGTPEPASFAIWAGFAGLGLVAMRRRRLLKLR